MKILKENEFWLIIDNKNAIYIQDYYLIRSLYYYYLSFKLIKNVCKEKESKGEF